MTRSQAIDVISHHKANDITNAYEIGEALNMAIEALEQVPRLERRCFALTNGRFCLFCRYNCTFKKEPEDYKGEKKN